MPLAGVTVHNFRLGRGIQSIDCDTRPTAFIGSHCRPSAFLPVPPRLMSDMVGKKSKKLQKRFQKHLFLGIPTNIAVGPLGFRAELDTDPIGDKNRPRHNLAADRSDSSIAMLDENNPGPSRIVFDNKSEDQGLHAPETSIPSGVIDHGTEHRSDPASECS